jgi:hypothetical protein
MGFAGFQYFYHFVENAKHSAGWTVMNWSNKPADKGFWTTSELGLLFGCHTALAARAIDKGVLPGHRLPGSKRRVVMHDQLLRYLDSDPQYRGLIPRAKELTVPA